jgi:hypothetical protein
MLRSGIPKSQTKENLETQKQEIIMHESIAIAL